MDRQCIDCGKALSPRGCGTTGRCRNCITSFLNSDPEMLARRRAGIAARFADPVKRAEHVRLAITHITGKQSDPEYRAWMVENGKRIYRDYLDTPEARAKVAASRARSGRKRTDTVLAWCPAEYREEYRFLVHKKRFPAREAREIVKRQIKDDQRRARARQDIDRQLRIDDMFRAMEERPGYRLNRDRQPPTATLPQLAPASLRIGKTGINGLRT